MATTTTNFGWDVPTSTDLVKNGATAISTLGQDIDTTMAELKGGTTGQVLSKTSNTDMDFTWVAQDDSNAIQNTIVDAKGDLIAASAADTPARLAVGNNGETLVADSSTSTGLRYQAPVQQNPVLNSAFQIWQRGTSITNGSYSADRWQAYGNGNGTVSRQSTNDTTNLPNIQYCGRSQRTSGSTSTNPLYLAQNFETINSIPFAGKTVTFSFYARAGANYSPTSSLLNYTVQTGTGTDQAFTGYTGVAYPINSTATLTTTWQRFTATAALSSSLTELAIVFVANVTGTAGANDYFEVTGVQLEVGSVATPFHTYAATIQGELAACQRYFRSSYSQGVTIPTNSTSAGIVTFSATSVLGNGTFGRVQFSTIMRVSPTITTYSYVNSSTGVMSDFSTGANLSASSAAAYGTGTDGFNIYNASGGTAAGIYGFMCHYKADAEL